VVCADPVTKYATTAEIDTPADGSERKLECLTCVKALTALARYVGGMKEQPLIDSGREKILSLTAETQFAPNGIVSRTLLRTANSRTVLFGFAEGQELTEHTSTQHALIQILSGECEFSLAGKPHQLKAGDVVYMPPSLAHAVKATKQFSMLLTLSKRTEPLAAIPEIKTSLAAAA